jgi:hypothetical protein
MLTARWFEIDINNDEKLKKLFVTLAEEYGVVREIIWKVDVIDRKLEKKQKKYEKHDSKDPKVQRASNELYDFGQWLFLLKIELMKRSYGMLFVERNIQLASLMDNEGKNIKEIKRINEEVDYDLNTICNVNKYYKHINEALITLSEISERIEDLYPAM